MGRCAILELDLRSGLSSFMGFAMNGGGSKEIWNAADLRRQRSAMMMLSPLPQSLLGSSRGVPSAPNVSTARGMSIFCLSFPDGEWSEEIFDELPLHEHCHDLLTL